MFHLDVRPVPRPVWADWIERRHYAQRVPIVTHAFGLFHDDFVVGVCTFGPPPRNFNDSFGLFGGDTPVPCHELNRLVTDDDLGPNVLSWFLVRCLRQFDMPTSIVSYADPNKGHHGYIYQATNFYYLGLTGSEIRYLDASDREMHARTVVSLFGTRKRESLPDGIRIEEQQGKHRYLYLHATKKDRRRLLKALQYPILPYPKGDNQTYDTKESQQQGRLNLENV